MNVWAVPLPPLVGQRPQPGDSPAATWAPGTSATTDGKRELVGGAMGDLRR